MTTMDNDSNIPEVPDPIASDTCEKSSSELLDYIKELKSKLAATEAEKDELQKMNHEKHLTVEKYINLTCLLRSSLECPVCLEVPLAGPFPQCRNGHLVCAKCKRTECPICRVGMAEENSLLAVKILDNIEHTCKHKGCNELFSRDNLETHMKVCPYRKIKCPAPSKKCGVEIPFCSLLDHILTECNGSENKCDGGEVYLEKTMPVAVEVSFRSCKVGNIKCTGWAFQWQERFFYATAENDDGAFLFNILYLGDKSECNDLTVEITVTKDPLEKSRNSVKVVGQPLPVDVTENERKKNGLMVGNIQLEKIANHINNRYTFDVTWNIY